MWNPDTGTLVRELTNHQAHIPDLAVSPDGHWLASASADQTVRLWDISSSDPASWTNCYILRGHEDELQCLAFSADSKRLITGDREGSVRLWQVQPAETQPALHVVRTDCGFHLRLSPDSKRIATFWSEGECLIWDMDTGRKMDALGAPGGIPGLCQFSPDGQQLLVGGPGGKLRVWEFGLKSWSEFDTGRPGVISTQPSVWVPITNLVLLQQATLTNVQFTLWRFGQRTLASEFQVAGKPPRSCNLSSRGDFAMMPGDGSLTLQKTTPPFAQTNFWPHRRGVKDVAFTPDGSLFATAGEDGVARLWDSATRREILPALKGQILSTIRALDISADGRRLVTAGAGRGAVKLWDIQTHQELMNLDFADQELMNLDSEFLVMNWILFSADGNKLVGLNKQNHLHIWRAPSWEEIAAAEANEPAEGKEP